ncbi:hypothetical protein AXF42_Ash017807 [Apostasia shenzhenica]|uniref:Uncharacterized protein n=1 Tax=Apostasia shenzhenica TaxID=1088818 RepID=A0A2I0A3X1_9ASPA|nr:hypothetical protein AXF42_Ash017807 [Apostasia shenzhenica]
MGRTKNIGILHWSLKGHPLFHTDPQLLRCSRRCSMKMMRIAIGFFANMGNDETYDGSKLVIELHLEIIEFVITIGATDNMTLAEVLVLKNGGDKGED